MPRFFLVDLIIRTLHRVKKLALMHVCLWEGCSVCVWERYIECVCVCVCVRECVWGGGGVRRWRYWACQLSGTDSNSCFPSFFFLHVAFAKNREADPEKQDNPNLCSGDDKSFLNQPFALFHHGKLSARELHYTTEHQPIYVVLKNINFVVVISRYA